MKKIIAILIAACLAGCVLQDNELSIGSLANTDSVVVLQINSRKHAKVDIFHSTVERTIHGNKPPDEITLSFLHFPECERLSVGSRYLCAIRNESSDDYTLIRSDMLAPGSKADLLNFFWKADSPKAIELEKRIGTYNKANDGN